MALRSQLGRDRAARHREIERGDRWHARAMDQQNGRRRLLPFGRPHFAHEKPFAPGKRHEAVGAHQLIVTRKNRRGEHS